MLVACYVLVHWNEMVFNTYEIQQIHVTFYLVSTYIYAVYSPSLLIDSRIDNVDKCSVKHIGHNNMKSNYNMSNHQLPTTDQQQDLGIIITKDLKWQKQTEKSWKTANRVLGFIARYFRYKNKELILPLYKSLVRQHLEHAVQFWSPHLRRDIDKMEKIQIRATKMIPEIRNHSYHQRIQDLDLISLVQRRLRGQLIEVFKYLNRFTTASARGLFDYDLNNRTRNNGVKLIVKHFNTSVA